MATEQFNVGGLLLDRPFKIRRLGHFGLYLDVLEGGLEFYTKVLGFQISDAIDFQARAEPGQLDGLGDTKGYFTRYGTDHHAMVLFPKRVREALDVQKNMTPGVTMNQIPWQCGSLREVTEASSWLAGQGVRIYRSGRDTPGSNWHTYPFDPDDHINELYYGIEQIGWNGRSKPHDMYNRGFRETPELPQMPEYQEVDEAVAADVDLLSGHRASEAMPAKYDVGGILLPRPFKIVRIGPVRLFVADVEKALGFYRDKLGFAVSEEVVYDGHRCVFLRANTEHHSVALYPIALREVLGLSPHSTMLSFGLQVNDYQQLRDAISFVEEQGYTVRYLPPELSPGIDYSAFAMDPDGHAIQLYYYMEQIGWDGRPRPAAERRVAGNGSWPEALEPAPGALTGEAFLGPWG